jgi:YHS domain-containing protein
MKNFIMSAVAGAVLVGMSTVALAVTGEYDNMCTMGLAAGKDVATDCSVNAQIGGKTYCFGNEEAKAAFMKDPEGNLAKAQAYYATKNQKNPG